MLFSFQDLPRCQLNLANGDESDSSASQSRPRRRAVKAPQISDTDDDSDSGNASDHAPEADSDESATAAVPSPVVQSAARLPPQRSLLDCPKCFESFARREGFRRHVAECTVGERSCAVNPGGRSSRSSGSDAHGDEEEAAPAARRRDEDQSDQEASPEPLKVAESSRGTYGQ